MVSILRSFLKLSYSENIYHFLQLTFIIDVLYDRNWYQIYARVIFYVTV